MLEAMEANSLYRLPSIDAARDRRRDARATDERFGVEDEEFDAVDDRVAVRELLSVLPARERRIVYLRFFEGRTQSEIADRRRHQPDARLAPAEQEPRDTRRAARAGERTMSRNPLTRRRSR